MEWIVTMSKEEQRQILIQGLILQIKMWPLRLFLSEFAYNNLKRRRLFNDNISTAAFI
jgi:hypothetical protein